VNLRLHGDTIAAPGALDFAINLWPAPTPPWLGDALEAGLAARHHYPDEAPAKAAIAARHRRRPDEVLLLNGACEAFWLLAHALAPRRAACVHPGFTEPEAALRAAGTDIVPVMLDPDRWELDPADVPEDVDLVIVGNPNNPTGTLLPAERLRALARPGRLLVVDESFIDFAPAAEPADGGDVIVRSLTKIHTLAGIRAGYLLADPDLVARLDGHRQPWSVNALACHALAAAAGAPPSEILQIAAEVAEARTALHTQLATLPGVRVWPSAANFLLLKLDEPGGVIDGLADRGIAVRPCDSFPGLDGSYIRVAVRPGPDNARLVGALHEVLA
jgi:histidinol-phosphate/aromatic aminotransferase/cobyric acid decarboxylase-like protein